MPFQPPPAIILGLRAHCSSARGSRQQQRRADAPATPAHAATARSPAPDSELSPPPRPLTLVDLRAERPKARQRSPRHTLDLFPLAASSQRRLRPDSAADAAAAADVFARRASRVRREVTTPREGRNRGGGGGDGGGDDDPPSLERRRVAVGPRCAAAGEFGETSRAAEHDARGGRRRRRKQLTTDGADVGALLFPPGDDLVASDPFPLRRPDGGIPLVVEECWSPLITAGVESKVLAGWSNPARRPSLHDVKATLGASTRKQNKLMN